MSKRINEQTRPESDIDERNVPQAPDTKLDSQSKSDGIARLRIMQINSMGKYIARPDTYTHTSGNRALEISR